MAEAENVTLQYRCRRCGVLTDYYPPVFADEAEDELFSAREGCRTTRDFKPSPTYLKDHACEDGGKGINEIAGYKLGGEL